MGGEPCCETAADGWKVESLVGVDERGQMVLPKEVRAAAGIEPGEKLALISCRREGEVCCLLLMPASKLSGVVKDVLGPILTDAL